MVTNPGDPDLIEQISDHIGRHVGPINVVFHEIVSDDLHIDLYHVAPDRDRPYHALITSGMSERPMKTPPEMSEFAYAELCILLDPSWDVRMEAFEDECVYWPVRLLKLLARYPGENDTWLGYGHSVAAHHPPKPFAESTKLCACVLLPPLSLGEGFFTLARPDGAQTHFWTVLPVFEQELQLKIDRGLDTLMDRLDRVRLTDVVCQERPNAATRRRWLGLF